MNGALMRVRGGERPRIEEVTSNRGKLIFGVEEEKEDWDIEVVEDDKSVRAPQVHTQVQDGDLPLELFLKSSPKKAGDVEGKENEDSAEAGSCTEERLCSAKYVRRKLRIAVC
jgi:hypothetical protein